MALAKFEPSPETKDFGPVLAFRPVVGRLEHGDFS
jgi:hypothetical protein